MFGCCVFLIVVVYDGYGKCIYVSYFGLFGFVLGNGILDLGVEDFEVWSV